MKTYLVLYGKPRYLGILTLEDAVELPKNAEILVRTSRGEDGGVCCGLLSSDALARLGQSLPGPSKEEGREPDTRELHAPGDVSRKNPGGSPVKEGSGQGASGVTKEDLRSGTRNGGDNEMEEIFYLGPLEENHRQALAALRVEEADALREARVMLRGHKLDMKLVDVEYPLDRKKIFLYFTSEQRVDFRGYVRDLAKIFKTRIELRQIGIRDEAKVAGGIAPCGLQCCCSRWLHRFAPICIRMVKEQNLALNPVKISGLCGRLMCCMGYEYATYHELWEHLPNPGAKLRGPRAVYSVSGVDLATQSVRLYGEGQEIVVPVNDFSTFKKNLAEGISWVPENPMPPLSTPRSEGELHSSADAPATNSSRRQEGRRSGDRLGGEKTSRQEEGAEAARKKDGNKGGRPSLPLPEATSEAPSGDRRPPRGERGGKKTKPSGQDGEKKSFHPQPPTPKSSLPGQGGAPAVPSLAESNAPEFLGEGDRGQNAAPNTEKKRRRKRRRSGAKPDSSGETLSEAPEVRTEKRASEQLQRTPGGEEPLPRRKTLPKAGEGPVSENPLSLKESTDEGKAPAKRKRNRPRHRKSSQHATETSTSASPEAGKETE